MSLFADKLGFFYRFLIRESGKVSKLENQSKQLVTRMKSLFIDPSPTVVDKLEKYFSQPVTGKSSKNKYFTVRLTIRAFILTTSLIRVG